MSTKDARKRAISGMAVLAVLMAALAPSVSEALASWRGSAVAYLGEICTAQESRRVTGDSSRGAGGHGDRSVPFEHCPFCPTHAGSFGLPPSSSIAIPIVNGDRLAPSLYFRSPRPLFNWATAQPRAPPLAA